MSLQDMPRQHARERQNQNTARQPARDTPGTVDRTRRLADLIEEEIVLGWLQPRERLIEEDLAARFEVKRHIVREAIFELERIGQDGRTSWRGGVGKCGEIM